MCENNKMAGRDGMLHYFLVLTGFVVGSAFGVRCGTGDSRWAFNIKRCSADYVSSVFSAHCICCFILHYGYGAFAVFITFSQPDFARMGLRHARA